MNQEEASRLVSSLFESWYSSIVRYAVRSTGSLELAEDTVQESFLVLYRELRQGTKIENPKAWTLCVVRRQISKQMRSYGSKALLHESLDVLDTAPQSWQHWQEPGFEEDDAGKLL